MKNPNKFISKDLYPYYLFLAVAIIYIYTTSKAEGFLMLNNLHNSFLDVMMPYITLLGDGLVVAIIAMLAGLFRLRYSIFLLLSFSISGLLVQFLKRMVFPDRLRPLAWFEQSGIDIHTLSGMDIPTRLSFPSGHTTSAFALFIGLSFLTKNWLLKTFFLFLSVMVGFSRIYLGVHFPEDVVAGSLIGVLTSFLCFIWVSRWKKDWLNVSLGSRILKSVKK